MGLTHQKTWSGRMLRKNIWNISYLVSPVLGSGPKQWNDRSNSEMVLVILPMKRNHVCSMEKHNRLININRHFIIQLIIQYTTAYFLLKRKNMCSHPLSGLQRALWNRNWWGLPVTLMPGLAALIVKTFSVSVPENRLFWSVPARSGSTMLIPLMTSHTFYI